jgi:hypothetical protein
VADKNRIVSIASFGRADSGITIVSGASGRPVAIFATPGSARSVGKATSRTSRVLHVALRPSPALGMGPRECFMEQQRGSGGGRVGLDAQCRHRSSPSGRSRTFRR